MRPFVLVAIFLLSLSAAAQKPDVAAKKHFEAGIAAAAIKDYPRAIAEFQKAYRLSPRPILLFNTAQSYRLMGQKPEAIASYKKFLGSKGTPEHAREARRWVAVLEEQVEEEARSAERARLEKERLEKERLAKKRNRAEARRRAKEAKDRRRRKKQREKEDYQEALRVAGDDQTEISGDGSVLQEGADPGADASDDGRAIGTLGFTGLATAGVGLFMTGAGIYFGLEAQSASDEIEGARGQWSDELIERFEQGETDESNMKLFGGIGLSMVALGTTLLVIDLVWRPGRKDSELTIHPSASARGTGLALSGRF